MSTTDNGRSDGHGPVFMGLYVRLLVRYLRLDEAWLLASLRDDGIRIERYAYPVFVDPHPAFCLMTEIDAEFTPDMSKFFRVRQVSMPLQTRG
jgi:hypothetical protein